jgi:hypothetical protein
LADRGGGKVNAITQAQLRRRQGGHEGLSVLNPNRFREGSRNHLGAMTGSDPDGIDRLNPISGRTIENRHFGTVEVNQDIANPSGR